MSTYEPNAESIRRRVESRREGNVAPAANEPVAGTPVGDAPASDATNTRVQENIVAERPGPGHALGEGSSGENVPLQSGVALDLGTMLEREKEQYGGIKIGSAFFGWLAATGVALLLTALLAAIGTAVGLSNNVTVAQATEQAQSSQALSLGGAIVLLVVLLVAYYCGGYVAGRMARFNGAKQGLAVWGWAVVMAVLVAVLSVAFGSRFNVLNSMPRLPLNGADLTTVSIIAVIVVALISLVGAVLGGLAGMRFHRRVDRAGFEDGTQP
jgi:amino acid transporter